MAHAGRLLRHRSFTGRALLLVVLAHGTAIGQSGAPAYSASMNGMAYMVTANRPGLNITGPIVSSIPPLGAAQAAKNANVVAYNALIPGIVAAHAANGRAVHFIDSYSVVSLADLSEDGIHIRASGYSRIAALWFDKIMAVR